jgi:glycosyltransferase involved in cell wall biosynthesis
MLVAETIRRLGPRITPFVLCLDQVGTMGEQLAAQGVPVIAYGRRPGVDLGVSWRMARDLRAHRIDVVHAHQYTPFFYASIAARLSGQRPFVIFTEHGRHYPDVVSAKRRLVNRLVFDRLADRVNAVCAFSAGSLAALDGFSGPRIEVIPNGVDLPAYAASADRTALRTRLGLDPSRRYIATIARFHPVKDHRTLVHAFAQVAKMVLDADLLLVGDGELRAELVDQVSRLGLAARVRFMGVRRDVADILQAADVFALTSVSEAASITLLEAMASGLPVVVTAVGGNPEIVRDQVDGFLAPRGDAAALAEAMTRLLSEPQLAARMGQAGRERVAAKFQIQQTVERYYDLYASDGRAGRVA